MGVAHKSSMWAWHVVCVCVQISNKITDGLWK